MASGARPVLQHTAVETVVYSNPVVFTGARGEVGRPSSPRQCFTRRIGGDPGPVAVVFIPLLSLSQTATFDFVLEVPSRLGQPDVLLTIFVCCS